MHTDQYAASQWRASPGQRRRAMRLLKRWFSADFAVLDATTAEYIRRGEFALGGDSGIAPKCAAKQSPDAAPPSSQRKIPSRCWLCRYPAKGRGNWRRWPPLFCGRPIPQSSPRRPKSSAASRRRPTTGPRATLLEFGALAGVGRIGRRALGQSGAVDVDAGRDRRSLRSSAGNL